MPTLVVVVLLVVLVLVLLLFGSIRQQNLAHVSKEVTRALCRRSKVAERRLTSSRGCFKRQHCTG